MANMAKHKTKQKQRLSGMCSDIPKGMGYSPCQPERRLNNHLLKEQLVMTVLRDDKGAPLFFEVQTANTKQHIARGVVRITANGPGYEWSADMTPEVTLALNQMADRLIS